MARSGDGRRTRAGGMAGRADKGIILTTGAFTAEARREASRDGAPPIERLTLDEVGERYELTRERIRQIEAKALEKIRQHHKLGKLKGYE